MIHYICEGGCKGESDKPGMCQAIDCPNFGKELTGCHCEDGAHHTAEAADKDTTTTITNM